jgi:hypothetical protein
LPIRQAIITAPIPPFSSGTAIESGVVFHPRAKSQETNCRDALVDCRDTLVNCRDALVDWRDAMSHRLE